MMTSRASGHRLPSRYSRGVEGPGSVLHTLYLITWRLRCHRLRYMVQDLPYDALAPFENMCVIAVGPG